MRETIPATDLSFVSISVSENKPSTNAIKMATIPQKNNCSHNSN